MWKEMLYLDVHMLATESRQYDSPIYRMEKVPKEVERFVN